MSSKRGKTISKKTKNNHSPKNDKMVEIEEENFSDKDSKLIEDSFKIIKTLNSQVGRVEMAKEKLQKDMSKLNSRLSKHEENTQNNFQSKFFLSVKEEIIKDFTPLLQKIDFKSVKVDIFKEIGEIIDIEIQKIKSEVDLKSKKTHRDINKKVSELETRIVDALKTNETIKKELKKFESYEITNIVKEFEERIHNAIENITKKTTNMFNLNSEDIGKVKSELEEQKKESKSLSQKLEKLRRTIKQIDSKDQLDLSSIESKILKLENENESIKSLVEKYENELYDRKANEESSIEQKVKKILSKTEKKLKEVQYQKGSLENLFNKYIEEINKELRDFELKVAKVEKENSQQESKKLSKEIESLKKNLNKDIEKTVSNLSREFDENLTKSLSEFNAEKSTLEKSIEMFKNEISSLVKNYVEELDGELMHLKSKTEQLEKNSSDSFNKKYTELENITKKFEKDFEIIEKEKEAERNFLTDKYNEVVEKFTKLSNENKEEREIIRKGLETQVQSEVEENIKDAKEKIAKEIVSINEHFTRLSTENKEDRKKLSEDIENKFLNSKQQYENIFNSHLDSFDRELKSKEYEFLEKLTIIEEEKNQSVKELDEFKSEISKLTKEYVEKLNEEFEKIKDEELLFDEKKKDFENHVEALVYAKKTEIEDTSQITRESVKKVIEEEKETFERHENTFRDIFNEKILNLQDSTKKKLENIEKKFIDKNLKVVSDKIEEEKKRIELISESIYSKSDEIEKRIELIEKKEDDFYSQLDSEINNMNEKAEERITSMEQQFNKRFLDYDTSFSSFKGVIIEEVEDLMREVDNIMNVKSEDIDKNLAKINFVKNEAIQILNEAKENQNKIFSELTNLRDEINDINVKFENKTKKEIQNFVTSSLSNYMSNVKSTISAQQQREFEEKQKIKDEIENLRFEVEKNSLTNDSQGINSMKDFVNSMSEYEIQLTSLIKTLKKSSMSNDEINEVLVSKGHPRIYVKMILEEFDSIYQNI